MVVAKLDNSIFWTLLLYAFVSSLSNGAANVAAFLALVLAVVRTYLSPIKPPIGKGLLLALGFFIFALVVSSVFAYDRMASIDAIRGHFFRMTMFFITVTFVNNKRQAVALVSTLLFSMFISDIYAIWQGLNGDHRAQAFTHNPMIFAGYLQVAIPLAFLFGLEKGIIGRHRSMFFLFCGALSLVALLYNGTRGAWLAVGGVILFYILLNLQKQPRKVLWGLTIFLIILSILLVIPDFRTRLLSINNFTTDLSIKERFAMWQSAWHMFVDHPLTGIGPGNFNLLYKTKYILAEATSDRFYHAHNNFLHFLAETGMLGFSAFVWLICSIMTSTLRAYLTQNNLCGFIAFLITASLMLQGFTQYTFGDSAVIRMYWFVLGIMYADMTKNFFLLGDASSKEKAYCNEQS